MVQSLVAQGPQSGAFAVCGGETALICAAVDDALCPGKLAVCLSRKVIVNRVNFSFR